jgi:hypothetical protein
MWCSVYIYKGYWIGTMAPTGITVLGSRGRGEEGGTGEPSECWANNRSNTNTGTVYSTPKEIARDTTARASIPGNTAVASSGIKDKGGMGPCAFGE